jgi:riboflavin kinase/FMN adenylyltransferase
MGAILVSDNFRFGHKHSGDVAMLAALGRLCGFATRIMETVAFRGEIISSTVIRRLVALGRVSGAARLLGKPFVLTGEIRPGTGTGSKLVFPTLNLAADQELLPPRGVYITETQVQGRSYRSVTNVGVRPTFNGSALVIESHLFNFSDSVTSGPMEIRFCRRLREEKRFAGAGELRAQIVKDMDRASRFWERLRKEGTYPTRASQRSVHRH